MNQYFSRLMAIDYALYPAAPYKGRGWFVTFEDYPTFKHSGSMHINGISYPGKCVIIHARSVERAQYASDLLHASYFLLKGRQISSLPMRSEVISIDLDGKLEIDEEDNGHLLFVGTSDIPAGCLVAAKSSHRRFYQNAIFKYTLSLEIFPTSHWELDPVNWRPSKFVFDIPDHNTRCAYAIVIAYSSLEDLGLEIRANKDNPSFLENGQWNPRVRNDLEERLKNARISLSDTIPWVIRDTPTRLERLKPPRALTSAKWATGRVRDIELELVDAIAYSSWLRSKVSAHALHDLTGALSYYDVSNIQHLSRRLILERLGFWKPQPGQELRTLNGT